ncbi:MAG: prefoldin subunit [Candidatus Micrarchaeota archaeon]|nr:prefoldin subunit [Candidatus Micrarchaeota archaeon]
MAQQATPQENDAEKAVRDYQTVQEQLRSATLQFDQLQVQKAELAKAKDEVSGSSGKVYITMGGVIVETTKDKALADIKDKSELADVRIGSLTKQLNDLRAKEKQLGEKLTQLYKQSQGPS